MLLLGLACLLALDVSARTLAVPTSDLQPAELVAVQGVPEAGIALLLLRSTDGAAELPMFTGNAEAAAIERAWRKLRPERPLTHELLGDLLQATGWRVERLIIDELRAGQFLAALELRNERGDSVRLVDTRPSDGLALALRHGAPLFVARQVFEAAEREAEQPTERAPVLAT